jgi:hypothetical protein
MRALLGGDHRRRGARAGAVRDARTRTRSVLPTSTDVTVYVLCVAPLMFAQLPPFESQRVYRRVVNLSGSVSNGQTGQQVTIMEHRFPFGRTAQVGELATARTAADGSFSFTARPVIRTLYTAKTGNARSDAVAVDVRPRLRLTHAGGRHGFLLRAYAIRAFVGKYGVLQRWNRRPRVGRRSARLLPERRPRHLADRRVAAHVPRALRSRDDSRRDAAEADGAGLHLRLQPTRRTRDPTKRRARSFCPGRARAPSRDLRSASCAWESSRAVATARD